MLDSFELPSFVRAHHVYQAVLTPFEGQVLQLQREPRSNPKDRVTGIVCQNGEIVRRVSFNLAPAFSPYLARECGTITATIAGA